MLGGRQEQTGGDGSTNIQGQTVTVNNGLSLSEARQVALDVFRAEYQHLSGQAVELARARVEEITDKFLDRLHKEYPAGVGQAADPDFQYGLLEVQKAYARSGDREMGDVLIDLLKERAKADKRSFVQVVLNESLSVVPKLTPDQLNAVTLDFVFRYTAYRLMTGVKALRDYLTRQIAPFVNPLSKQRSSYQHIEYARCGSISLMEISLERILREQYPAMFSEGFTADEVATIGISPESPLLMPCLHDSAKLQMRGIDHPALDEMGKKHGVDDSRVAALKELEKRYRFADPRLREFVVSLLPSMAGVFDCWNDSPLKELTLTSVGMAIGHANLRRVTGEGAPLEIWIKS